MLLDFGDSVMNSPMSPPSLDLEPYCLIDYLRNFETGEKKEKDCSKRYIHRLFDMIRYQFRLEPKKSQ